MHLCRPCACCDSHREFIRASLLWCLERPRCFVLSLLALIDSQTLLQQSFLHGWEWFHGDFPFMTECFKIFHSLPFVQLWVSLFVPIYSRRELHFSCWARDSSLIRVEHHRSYFVPIYVYQNSNSFYSPSLRAYLVSGSPHQSTVGQEFSLIAWTLNAIR